MTLNPGPDFRRFILENTSILAAPYIPEIKLHLADEAHDLWHRTEEKLQQSGLQPPFWAFAWAGGQGLARYILDNPKTVEGKSVLDFATGSGLVAIAVKMAGADQVTAVDIDPFSGDAVAMNSALNAQDIRLLIDDLVGKPIDADVLLAGDVFYDRSMSDRVTPWFVTLAKLGTTILIGDPGRHYVPHQHLKALSTHEIPVTRALEDADFRKTTVWQFIA